MAKYGSLAGPSAKLERARSHLDEIDRIVTSRSDVGGYQTRPVFSPDGRTCSYYVDDVEPIDAAFPLVIGDCLFNLRAALDHLVYQLHVRTARGAITGGAARDAMFPILDKPPRGAVPLASVDSVKRLSKRHRAVIERLQPYRSDRDGYVSTRIFLRLLHDLNRFDKHRQLNVVAVAGWANAVSPYPRPAGLTMKADLSVPLVSGALVAKLFSDDDFRDHPVGHRVLSNIVFDDLDGKPEVVTLMHQMTGSVERVLDLVGRDLARQDRAKSTTGHKLDVDGSYGV